MGAIFSLAYKTMGMRYEQLQDSLVWTCAKAIYGALYLIALVQSNIFNPSETENWVALVLSFMAGNFLFIYLIA